MLNLSHNQRLLLDLLRRHGPLPRARLSAMTGLTRGAVTRLTKELLDRELLLEGEPLAGARGQPALPLALAGRGAHGVGASFGPRQIDVVLVDLAGNLVGHRRASFLESSPEAASERVASLASEIRREARLAASGCVGLGLALPGYRRPDSAAVQTVPDLANWIRDDLPDVFGRHRWPVFTENVASAGAFGEFYFSRRKQVRDLVYLHLGYGIGAGLIVDGALAPGARGNAGEIGARYPKHLPRPSGADLLDTLKRAGLACENFAALADRAELAQHPAIVAWIARAAEQLFPAVFDAYLWLDPQEIVLGGPIPSFVLSPLGEALTQAFSTLLPERGTKPTLCISTLGATGPAIGAAMIPLHAVCSPLSRDDAVYRPIPSR